MILSNVKRVNFWKTAHKCMHRLAANWVPPGAIPELQVYVFWCAVVVGKVIWVMCDIILGLGKTGNLW